MRYLATQFMRDEDEVVVDSAAWDALFVAHRNAIQRIDNPRGSGALTLRRPEAGIANDPAWLRARFVRHLLHDEGIRAVTEGSGGFDVLAETEDGMTTAFDWAAGDLGGLRRSVAAMAAAFRHGTIRAGILIIPSAELKELLDLPDRATTAEAMQAWGEVADGIARGTFGLTIVEHDGHTNAPAVPPLALPA
ncbi:PDDEXK family nuclease [Neoroseomonas oryzicola]|uniref:Uncharacterized protein n=1 Tax=Neoroseomonas oryzicola TaxID=535904 RepID=A0A9X9WL05_9PROT|nr:hypothetical protein [Neoroseomonas oryzicola]MBR0661015.1 hypothetical protein [Neoroseomonas oryzicola]NKE19194.1 hypothetical protein [Neoroseomonas oryzicola]